MAGNSRGVAKKACEKEVTREWFEKRRELAGLAGQNREIVNDLIQEYNKSILSNDIKEVKRLVREREHGNCWNTTNADGKEIEGLVDDDQRPKDLSGLVFNENCFDVNSGYNDIGGLFCDPTIVDTWNQYFSSEFSETE